MSQLHLARRATLRDFLRDTPRSQARTVRSSTPQAEGIIILDYIPHLEELGEVIRRFRPVGGAQPGTP